MKYLSIYLLLASIFISILAYGESSSENNTTDTAVSITIDEQTKDLIANGDADAVVAVLAAANVDPYDPVSISEAVRQIIAQIEDPQIGN